MEKALATKERATAAPGELGRLSGMSAGFPRIGPWVATLRSYSSRVSM